MVALESPDCNFGAPAPDFNLPGVDGRDWSLADVRGENGTVIVFICNHCPFVVAAIDRLIRDAVDLTPQGIGFAAIMSNDTVAYPADSFEHMQSWADQLKLPFPYLLDESQQVARDFGAICTPDFFGYNADLQLQYRGRLDAGRTGPLPAGSPRELYDAMRMIASTGEGPRHQTPGIGCSIKWRSDS